MQGNMATGSREVIILPITGGNDTSPKGVIISLGQLWQFCLFTIDGNESVRGTCDPFCPVRCKKSEVSGKIFCLIGEVQEERAQLLWLPPSSSFGCYHVRT